jgi:NTE family protein
LDSCSVYCSAACGGACASSCNAPAERAILDVMVRWSRALVIALVFSSLAITAAAQTSSTDRPRIAIALGGGSARGLAHVGVLRWLEEHRVPIDAIAGTSMGGLIGGAYAAGMSPDAIEAMLANIDWDAAFGNSGFRFDHVRRKRDLREYSSRLEFGIKHGLIAGPPALNGGLQVGLVLARITAAYSELTNFDALPTPFRCVATDLRTATPVVLQDGSLARAMRATMAMPMVFPPVTIGEQILVDGGALNNLPTDVARAMGAQTVIAVNVADLGRKNAIDYTLLGLVTETMDAMIRAQATKNLALADIAITVPLDGVLPSHFNRVHEVISGGYAAAEQAKDKLLPLALDQAAWNEWQDRRRSRTITQLAVPAFVRVEGAGPSDARRIERRLAGLRGAAIDIDAIEQGVSELGGLDRFETVTWEIATDGAQQGLVIRALPKANGPPLIFLGGTLENTTSNEFRVGFGARLLLLDVPGSGSELRIDGVVGSEPGMGVSWHRPIGSTPLFFDAIANARTHRINVIEDERIIADYGRRRIFGGLDIGLNPGRLTEFRIGARAGRTDATVRIGDGRLPDVKGQEASLVAAGTYDGQDDPLLPARGTHLVANALHTLRAPDVDGGDPSDGESVTMAEAYGSWFRSLTPERTLRLFIVGGVGRTINGDPLYIDRFALGGPARMTAFGIGEQRTDHYAYGGVGLLQRAFRLPDFMGRSIFVGGWVESGKAWDHERNGDFTVHASGAIIADTLIGPLFAGASAGVRGESRFFIGIGRIFR